MRLLNREDDESQRSCEDLEHALEICQQELNMLRGIHQQELENRQQVEDALRNSQQMLQLVCRKQFFGKIAI